MTKQTTPEEQPVDTKKTEPGEANPKLWLKVRDGAIATVATLALTGVVGDFIIKRNVVGYNKELAAFETAAKDGEDVFKKHQAYFNRLLADRRGVSQTMANIIADQNLPGVHAFYDEYFKAVKDWNNGLDEIGRTILNASQCNRKHWSGDKTIRAEVIQPIFASVTGRQEFFMKTKEKKAKEAEEDILKTSKFCPTHFLTKTNSKHSVHTVFKKMHRKISELKKHPYSQCVANHRNNISQYYQSCTSWNKIEEVQACMKNADELVYSNQLCSHIPFNHANYKVVEDEFVELDFYWDLGNTFFKEFKQDFMLRYCQNKIRFWGNFMGWDCEAQIAAKFE